MSSFAPWFALAMMAGAAATSIAAVRARALFAMCLYLAAAGALGASALLALGAGDAGLGLALVMAGLAPFVLLATMLLSGRTIKVRRAGMPWLTMAAAFALGAAILVAAPDFKNLASAHAAEAPIALWLAPLLFVAALVAIALLGFGERGQLEHAPERDL